MTLDAKKRLIQLLRCRARAKAGYTTEVLTPYNEAEIDDLMAELIEELDCTSG